jgi:CheY-like chemotaxis protein
MRRAGAWVLMAAPSKDVDQDARPRIQTVLVVDDEVLIRLSIAGYLRDCGFTVLEADGPREAIAILEAQLVIDVVFSDVQMPGEMDGFGLARWVRAHRPGVKVILASGVVKASQAATQLCEHDAFLEKPYHEQQVGEHVKSLLGARKSS